MNKLFFGALLFGVAVSGGAVTLASNTTGGSTYNGVAYGQSVTMPTGGPWDNIAFNLIDPNGNAYATGGLYVLTLGYSGTPAGLSSSTAGYLGFTSTINSGIWDFSGVTLSPGTQYFFYMDSIVPVGQGVELTSTEAYTGGDAYGSGGPGTFQSASGYDMEFVLTGNQVSDTPEPGTLSLVAGSAVLAAAFRRRRPKKKSTAA